MTIPSVVTADEVFAVLAESPLCRPGIERGEVAVAAGQVALMFAARTAAAVAAERACWESALADERSGRGSWGGEKDRWRLDAAKHIEQVAAANRVRGQSEVPASGVEERAAYWRTTVEVGRVDDDRCYVGPGAEALAEEQVEMCRALGEAISGLEHEGRGWLGLVKRRWAILSASLEAKP